MKSNSRSNSKRVLGKVVLVNVLALFLLPAASYASDATISEIAAIEDVGSDVAPSDADLAVSVAKAAHQEMVADVNNSSWGF